MTNEPLKATHTPLPTITFEVDVGKLFDAVAKVGDGGTALGERIARVLLCSGQASFAESIGLAAYGLSILPPSHAVNIHHDLIEALRALELANDRVCGARPQRVYDAMIAAGMSDALLALDEARLAARAILTKAEAGQ